MATKRRKVITPPFRLSFPSIFQVAKQMEDAKSKPKYEVTGIWDPSKFTDDDKKRFKDMEAILDEASMEKFKRPVAKLPTNYRKAFRDGAEKEHLGGYGDGKVFAKMSTMVRPGAVLRDKVTVVTEVATTAQGNMTGEDIFYPGCWCRATVTAYAYDNKSKGVSFGLSNIIFWADGDRFDSRTDAADDFGELPESAGNDDDLM